MIKLQEIVGLPTLQYHLDNELTLSECVYRYSSDSFVQLFNEARQAWRDGKIVLPIEDVQLLESTDIGEYGEYEGQKVPLDLPMAYEEINPRLPRAGEQGGNIKQNMTVTDKENRQLRIIDITDNKVILKPVSFSGEVIVFPDNYDQFAKIFQFWDYFNLDKIVEADYHGQNVTLGKPKRGGPKKFYVYVRDPKSKKVKKVNFGGTTGLSVKIDDPKARHSFAARHKCATEKNRLSPNYWGCHIGRYWKSLGGAKNFSGYW